jgi:hypothetical protein
MESIISKMTVMKNILIGMVILCSSIIFSGCLKSDLVILENSNKAEMTGFDFEYRWLSTDTIKRVGVVVEIRTVSNAAKMINTMRIANHPTGADTIYCSLSLPDGIPSKERKNVKLDHLLGYAAISDAAKVIPTDGSPVLGKPGNFTNSVSYTVIAANGSSKPFVVVVNPLPIVNQWEGLYQESGTLVRGTGSPETLNAEVYLSSININTCRAQAGKSVFDNPAILYQIQINADNTVTIKSDPTASVTIIPQAGVASTYTPATKTFNLHYQYTTSALRKFDTKLVLK